MGADPRFFPSTGPHALAVIAAAAGAGFTADGGRSFTGVAPLQAAGATEVSFLDGRRWLPALRASTAGAVVLRPEFVPDLPPGTVALTAAEPYLAFARIAGLFHPAPAAIPGRHPTAIVAEDARLGAGCEIGPYAVVGAGAELGRDCVIGAHAVVGPGVVLGAGCRLHAHASISHAIAGDRVTLHPGARVGQEGFSFAPLPDGRFLTMPQLGRVLFGDDVEVGANATVDRGSGHDTVVGAGSRLDNLVQVGHNVRLGRGCVLAGLVGVSGSATLGDHVMAGGQAGVADHVTVGDRVRIAAKSGVLSDVPDGTAMAGSPAWPARETMRAMVRLRRLGAGSDGKAG